MPLTVSQLKSINAAERISSCFSLIGATFIITTFIFTNKFRRPINRLAFYAAFGNVFCNIATLIARGAILNMAGRTRPSPMCSAQAFLLQTFNLADCYIIMCMAINVYLTVIHKYSATRLRKLEPYYVGITYSVPFIVGFTFLFIDTPSRGPVYGPATIWCWISPKWDFLRIATFYAPIWVSCLITFCLFASTGRVIFRMRRSLREFAEQQRAAHVRTGSNTTGKLSLGPVIQLTTVTQVEVSDPKKEPVKYKENTGTGIYGANDHSYRVMCEGSHPSSLVKKGDIDSDEELGEDEEPQVDIERQRLQANGDLAAKAAERARNTLKANAAAVAYARVALLFFLALILTWIPSSMNRVYAFIHADKANYMYAFLSGLALPSQGFWNGIIYVSTSWSSVRMLGREIKANIKNFVDKHSRRDK